MIPLRPVTDSRPAFELQADDLVELDVVELAPGVLRTPLLSPSGCERLLDEIAARRGALSSDPEATRAPNSMHDHGAMFTPLGLDGVVDALRERLAPHLAQLYADIGGATLDHHHSYLVEYGGDLDEELGFHVDDSEVTLNLCLGESFSGAELVLLGRRCDRHVQSAVLPGETIEIDHEPGVCVVHAGRHRHRVDPILRGTRRNLIAWLRSSTHRGTRDRRTQDPRGAPCPPWCGLSGD